MITCLVCGKKYESGDCPRCQFPDVQVPGSREKAIQNLKPAIDSYRANFMNTVRLEIISYHWKDQNGTVVLDHEERLLLGSGTELLKGEAWLPTHFARIPDEKQLPLKILITAGEETRELDVSVPNLLGKELQQIGAVMDQDYNIRLLLRNNSEPATQSAPIALFD